jgi:hypothetical protein
MEALLTSQAGDGPISRFLAKRKERRKYKKLARQSGAKCKKIKGQWVCKGPTD